MAIHIDVLATLSASPTNPGLTQGDTHNPRREVQAQHETMAMCQFTLTVSHAVLF